MSIQFAESKKRKRPGPEKLSRAPRRLDRLTTIYDERFFAVARRARWKMPPAASDRARNNATGKKIHQKCSLSYRLGSKLKRLEPQNANLVRIQQQDSILIGGDGQGNFWTVIFPKFISPDWIHAIDPMVGRGF